ncbi:PAS domain S-box protein, partial [Gemmatimonadota bacterium]
AVREMVEVGDTLWVRTDRAIYWFDGFFWTRSEAGEGLPEGATTSLASGSEGQILAVVGGRVFTGSAQGFSLLPIPGVDWERYSARRAVPSQWGLVLTLRDREEDRFGVFLLEDEEVRDITPEDGLSRSSSLWRALSGTVWLNGDSGLLHYTGSGWMAVTDPSPELFNTSAFWETAQGTSFAFLSIPLDQRGLITWDSRREILRVPGEGENVVLSGTATQDGLVLVVYETGDVRILESGRWSSANLPPNRRDAVHFVYADSQGDIWFASAGGLHLYRRSLRRWTSLRHPFPDARNRVNDILLTGENEVWLGTGEGLLIYRDDQLVEGITEIRGSPLGVVTGLARDSTGGIWVTSGASFQGAYRWADGSWTRFGPEEGFDLGKVHRVEVTGDSAVWFTSLGVGRESERAGVYRLKEGSLEPWVDDQGWLDDRSYTFAQGPDGAYWFGSGRGLVRWRDGQWTQWGPEEGVGTAEYSRVFTLLPDQTGGVWFGSGPGATLGLGHLRGDGGVDYTTTEDGLPGNAVMEIAQGPQGSLWVSTESGLALRTGGGWSAVDGTSGLNPVHIWPIAFRGQRIFIGTTGGGLQILDRSEEENPPPRVVLVGPVSTVGESFRVRFRALTYRGEVAPERILVRDRINDPEEWSQWGTYRELWTTPEDDFGWGPQRVELQAKGLFGQLSQPLVVDFTVAPPVHLRPIFYVPFSLLALALGALLILVRRRRIRSDEAIRASEHRLRTLVNTAPDGIAIYDADKDRFIDVNENVMAMTGLSREEFLSNPLGGTSPTTGPDGRSSRENLLERVREALDGRSVTFEWIGMHRDGSEYPVEIHLSRFPSKEGRLARFSVLDIRGRKEAERLREELESQLRQSQKLEAVGQLTGGVAHDFNNLLTVIMGNLDLLSEVMGGDPEVSELVSGAVGAAERSALLTQRLLAFSRQQTLDTRSVDLEELVEGVMDLLKRSLGETIQIHTAFQEGLWRAKADPGQLEHAIINLAVNARDAMSRGGHLFLEGSNIVLERVRFGFNLTRRQG